MIKSRQTHYLAVLLVLIALALSAFALNPRTVSADTKMEWYETGDDEAQAVNGLNMSAQIFTANSTYVCTRAVVKIYKVGTPTTLSAYLYSTDNGSMNGVDLVYDVLDSATYSASLISSATTGTFYSMLFTSGVTLIENHKYAIVLSDASDNGVNTFYWRDDSAGATYAGGNLETSTDGGTTWTRNTAKDFIFRTYGNAAEDVEWEAYDTTDNAVSTDNVYDDNWTAQTFTAGTVPHSITRVGLKLYREGWPGTVTVSIRATDNTTFHPTGGDLTSGTLDGNALTDNTDGRWYYVDMVPDLITSGGSESFCVSERYAIVVRAVEAPNMNNCVWWRLNDVGAYANGNKEDSGDAGVTWVADTPQDYMFRVFGDQTDDLLDVAVFSDYAEDGDWLIGIYYRCQVPPAYPGETPYYYMNLTFKAGATYYAKVGMMAWGFRPASIYLSADAVDALGLTWGGTYTVSIECITAMWVHDPDDVDYGLLSGDWIGNSDLALDDWVRSVAQEIEDEEGVDIYTESVSGVTFDVGEGILTPTGADMFLLGIPGLDEIRPNLFYVSTKKPHVPGESSPPPFINPTTRLGTTIMNGLTGAGAVVGLDGKDFGALLLFALIVLAVNYIAKVSGDVRLPLAGGAITMIMIGWWTGLMSVALLSILIMFLVTMLIWRLFWSST